MTRIVFKHSNKQRLMGCASVFFSILFIVAFTLLIFNLGDFLENHAFEAFFIFVMGGIMAYNYFRNLQGGKELKANIALSANSLIVKGKHRYSLSDLCLDEYVSEYYHRFHLYTNDKMFTLYTNKKDDLIEQLLRSAVQKHTFEVDQYEFEQNSATVMIKTKSGRMLGFNLNSGVFSIFHTDDKDEDKQLYEPEYFIQTPDYKRK